MIKPNYPCRAGRCDLKNRCQRAHMKQWIRVGGRRSSLSADLEDNAERSSPLHHKKLMKLTCSSQYRCIIYIIIGWFYNSLIFRIPLFIIVLTLTLYIINNIQYISVEFTLDVMWQYYCVSNVKLLLVYLAKLDICI